MSIYKAYDIRGIYGIELSELDAYFLGYYLPIYLKIDKIKIAHDFRLSYQNLTKFLIIGLLDSNCKVEYLGLSSTPNFYFSLFKETNSGIMVTASHNPKEYNGFKLMHNGQSFDSSNGLYELEKLIKFDKDNRKIYFKQIQSSISNQPFEEFLEEHEIKNKSQLENYISYLQNFYEMILTEDEKNILTNINFNLDFSSGMSSLAITKFLENSKLNYKLFNEVPDGNFPIHSPDPMKAGEFIKTIKNNDEYFSAVFDGDGDRVVFYDGSKNLILPDYIIALLINYFIEQNHKKFVCDLRVSKTITNLIEKNNKDLDLIRVGRSFYKTHMDKNHCVYGAELSGHFFFRDFHNFDNPDFALIFILKIISQNLLKNKKIKFEQIINKYKTYYKLPEKNLKVKNTDLVLRKLKEKYNKNIVLEIDGLSFDFKNYWFNVRKSNTEPVIRINFEGVNEKIVNKEFNNLIKFIEKL